MSHPSGDLRFGDDDADVADFDVVMRGYDRGQVRERIHDLRDEVDAADQARLRALGEAGAARQELTQLDQENAELRSRLAGESMPTYAELGERIGQLLTLAEAEAKEIRAHAQDEAELLVERAREHAQRLVTQAREEDEASNRRREQSTHDHQDTLDRERAQAEREADDLIADARREADAARREAQEDVAVLLRQRDLITDQLAGLRDRLQAAVSAFGGETVDLVQAEAGEADALPLEDLPRHGEPAARDDLYDGEAAEDEIVAAELAAEDQPTWGDPAVPEQADAPSQRVGTGSD